MEDISYLSNKNLRTIKKDYLGNEYKNNRFLNIHGNSGSKKLGDILKWKLSKNPKSLEKKREKYELKVLKDENLLDSNDDFILWLGHASFLIQINGKKIITDPCLTSPPFIKRLTELPIDIDKIKPDYVLVSHGHYDHLDKNTIKEFDNSFALIPLGMSEDIKSMNPTIKTEEAGWYQEYSINEDFKIYFLPSYHWYRRTAFDVDKVLWGSYIIKTKNKTIYFAGDTAYSSHFKDISELFDIDIAILPIGAYEPRYFMKNNHMNPDEALKAFKDLKAKEFIPMHFGTFDLSDEPLGEPEAILKDIGIDENINFLDIGDKLYLS